MPGSTFANKVNIIANKNFFFGQEKFTTDEQKAWEKEQFGRVLAENVR